MARQLGIVGIYGLLLLGLITKAYSAEMRDPTQPIVNAESLSMNAVTDNFKVQGVFISPMARSALINNKWVRVGGTVDGARVLTIDRGQVVLLIAGHKKTVHLFGKIWKKLQ